MLVVSHRLPIISKKTDHGHREVRLSRDGLVTALSAVLRQSGGTWVGWPGTLREDGGSLEPRLARLADLGMAFCPVPLSTEEVQGHHHGFSNTTLWPLFHDLPSKCVFEPSYWKTYRAVNRKFAEAVARRRRERDLIWVHDYHLMLVASELRRAEVRNRVGFFLNIPFPGPDVFHRLPWKRELVDGLLQFDLLGFQRNRDRDNFIDCVRAFAKHTELIKDGSLIHLETEISSPDGLRWTSNRRLRLGSFPRGIDFDSFRRAAETEDVLRQVSRLRMELGGVKIILGVDRLDYTSGLPEKIRGFREALVRYPDLRNRVSLIQLLVPSESTPEHGNLRLQIERQASEINDEFGTTHWVPVRYFNESLRHEELVAFYRLADALLVTSLKDGMNLMAKEYCAANVDEHGVLLLSEFTGAASQLAESALVVNPHDVENVAAQIFWAVTMPEKTRRRNMSQLRETVSAHDVFGSVGAFLNALGRLADAPRPEPVVRLTPKLSVVSRA